MPAIVGLATGMVTIGFVELIDLVQYAALGQAGYPLDALASLPWLRILLVPAVGGLLVGLLVHFLAPEAEGHGVPEVIEAVNFGGGRIRKRVAVVKSLASAFTIGTGGSVGREGPIVQIGGAVGSAVGQLLRLPSEQMRTLAACGAAAGIAAVFNAPIAGAFFSLEVVTRNFAMPAFGPVIISAVLATVVSRGYFGDFPAFVVPAYQLESPWEIPVYAILGVFAGLVAVAFITCLDVLERRAATLPIPRIWRPAAGGLLLGAMILAVPNLYGVGYATMDRALDGTLPWTLLLLLLPAKIVATSLTLASGGSGGMFLPALYVGAITGGLFGFAVHGVFPGWTATSGAYALVGMSGVLAAATHSPITSILLLIEISGDYQIVLPVMTVTVIATLVGRAFKRDSVYTLKFSRRGIELNRREDMILRSHTVGQVMRPADDSVADTAPLPEILETFLEKEISTLCVLDAAGRLVGQISIHDVKAPGVQDAAGVVVARDIAENALAVKADATLADCLDRFLLSEEEALPVVDDGGRLVGLVSRRDVLRVYSSELLRQETLGVATAEDGEHARRLIRLPAEYHVDVVPVPPLLVGRTLRDAGLRTNYDLSVLAIRPAGGEDALPDPERPLRSDDLLVVVGKTTDLGRFQRRVRESSAAR